MVGIVNPYEESHDIGKAIREAKDYKSCTVVTLSVVTGNDFKKCDRYMRNYGRKYRKGMQTSQIVEAIGGLRKFKTVESPYSKSNRITISQFINKHPKGKFYCLVRGHALAIIDGVLYDHSEKLRRQITRSWRFYNEDDLNEFKNRR